MAEAALQIQARHLRAGEAAVGVGVARLGVHAAAGEVRHREIAVEEHRTLVLALLVAVADARTHRDLTRDAQRRAGLQALLQGERVEAVGDLPVVEVAHGVPAVVAEAQAQGRRHAVDHARVQTAQRAALALGLFAPVAIHVELQRLVDAQLLVLNRVAHVDELAAGHVAVVLAHPAQAAAVAVVAERSVVEEQVGAVGLLVLVERAVDETRRVAAQGARAPARTEVVLELEAVPVAGAGQIAVVETSRRQAIGELRAVPHQRGLVDAVQPLVLRALLVDLAAALAVLAAHAQSQVEGTSPEVVAVDVRGEGRLGEVLAGLAVVGEGPPLGGQRAVEVEAAVAVPVHGELRLAGLGQVGGDGRLAAVAHAVAAREGGGGGEHRAGRRMRGRIRHLQRADLLAVALDGHHVALAQPVGRATVDVDRTRVHHEDAPGAGHGRQSENEQQGDGPECAARHRVTSQRWPRRPSVSCQSVG